MWHTSFIAAHAVAGGIAFVTGCVTLARRVLFGTYLWSLVAMEALLALAIAADWATIDTAARILFIVFCLVGVLMIWRADQARRIRATESAAPSASYVAHVGFTLVALFDAFVVIVVLDAGAAIWLVTAVGILVAVAGHFVLRTVGERLVGPAGSRREDSLPE